MIRDLLAPDKYVIVVEHDLSVLDYLSDFICCLYGKPGAYGVVTLPFSVREGINIFLAGFVPTENLRFREEGLTFKVAENAGEGDDDIKKFARYTYPAMSKTQVRGCQLLVLAILFLKMIGTDVDVLSRTETMCQLARFSRKHLSTFAMQCLQDGVHHEHTCQRCGMEHR